MKRQNAELTALREENARFKTAFLEVCDERDHWHSRALIGDSKELTMLDEIARLREALEFAQYADEACRHPDIHRESARDLMREKAERIKAALCTPAADTAAPKEPSK